MPTLSRTIVRREFNQTTPSNVVVAFVQEPVPRSEFCIKFENDLTSAGLDVVHLRSPASACVTGVPDADNTIEEGHNHVKQVSSLIHDLVSTTSQKIVLVMHSSEVLLGIRDDLEDLSFDSRRESSLRGGISLLLYLNEKVLTLNDDHPDDEGPLDFWDVRYFTYYYIDALYVFFSFQLVEDTEQVEVVLLCDRHSDFSCELKPCHPGTMTRWLVNRVCREAQATTSIHTLANKNKIPARHCLYGVSTDIKEWVLRNVRKGEELNSVFTL